MSVIKGARKQRYRTIVLAEAQVALQSFEQTDEFVEEIKPFFNNLGNIVKERVTNRFKLLQNALGVVRNLIGKHGETLSLLRDRFQSSESVVDLNEQIKLYSRFRQKLANQINNTIKEIQQLKEQSLQFKSSFASVRNRLDEINKENIELTILISRASSVNRPLVVASPAKRRFERKVKQTKQVDETAAELLSQKQRLQRQYSRAVSQIDVYCRQFQGCMGALFEHLESSQKKVSSSSLKGTLLFRMMSNRNLRQQHSSGSIDLSGLSQDLANKTLMFGTLKDRVIKHRRKLVSQQQDFKVPWSKFRSFLPLQLAGLMNLQPQSFKEIARQISHRAKQLDSIIKK